MAPCLRSAVDMYSCTYSSVQITLPMAGQPHAQCMTYLQGRTLIASLLWKVSRHTAQVWSSEFYRTKKMSVRKPTTQECAENNSPEKDI